MSVTIHPTALIDPSAALGADVEIGPYCIVGPEVTLGDRVRLIAHVHIARWTEIGADTVVHPFAALGGPGQDLSYKGEDTRLIIGARNQIREHASMHRGTVRGRGETRVGDGGFFMAQSHVAHDCVVGHGVTLAHGATLGGHVRIEDFAILGGLSAIHQFGRVGRYAFVGGLAAVVEDVIPYGSVFGNHASLEGLNVVGLKRRGFSKADIHTIRACVRLIFQGEEGAFEERVALAAERFAQSAEAMEIIAFIRADAKRPLCRPRR